MTHVIFFRSNPWKWINKFFACLTKCLISQNLLLSCSVIGTGQQIDTKLMHHFEKFSKNLLVKLYSIKGFIFLTHKLKQGKTLVWDLSQCKTLEVSNPAMCSWSNHQKMSLFSDKKIAGLRYMTYQSLKNPLGQVNLRFFFKVTVCDHNEAS